MSDGDDYRRYSTMRDASGALIAIGAMGFIVGLAFGPVGPLAATLFLILPGCLLASKAKRIRPR